MFQQLLMAGVRELIAGTGNFNRSGDKTRRMRRIMVQAALMMGLVPALGACGFADSRAPLPEFMRTKASEPPPPEPPPDVKRLVREKLETVFVNTSSPHDVRVSQPHHEPNGAGWTACVKAELTSAMNKPLGTQTYLVTISGGQIIDRRRAKADDNCVSESYDPI
ncbi:hypothetical protein SAMN05444159_6313 [Bradyrhizobium lablabi]|uniref:Uncharacterized protein n=2 Tax=Bradyrhizobium lablabi TaxID=722472 RepID=A0A1M7BWE7_9BRAD|nr:hypothetical protein SAMN05444159_6313 [Bradyrhizobium lablabi]